MARKETYSFGKRGSYDLIAREVQGGSSREIEYIGTLSDSHLDCGFIVLHHIDGATILVHEYLGAQRTSAITIAGEEKQRESVISLLEKITGDKLTKT
ncbi:hypothetical protein HY450_01705 [Candidatus Pacearchaeota archaeon]|nr:hypothetical protein [Candidatus Pacearchaeota archaeon]